MSTLVPLAGVSASLALAGAVWWFAYQNLFAYDDIRLTATTLIAFAGTLTGFLMTALSLLVAVSDRRMMENLKRTGHFPSLVHQVFQSAALWLAVAVVGFAGHLVSGDLQRMVIALAFALGALALLKFLHVGRRFSIVIAALSRY